MPRQTFEELMQALMALPDDHPSLNADPEKEAFYKWESETLAQRADCLRAERVAEQTRVDEFLKAHPSLTQLPESHDFSFMERRMLFRSLTERAQAKRISAG